MPKTVQEDLRSTDAILDTQATASERPPVMLRIPETRSAANGAGGDSVSPTATEEEILTSIRYLWEPSDAELDAEPLPPPPMAAYNEDEFRFLMGAKQGPPTEAMQLFQDFLEPDFVSGLFVFKPIRKKVWDCMWSHGYEGMRLALKQSIQIVRSDTSTLDALKTAMQASGPARTRYLLAARIALGVQALVFNGLSSRPKYAGGSAMQNLQDSVIEGILEGYAA